MDWMKRISQYFFRMEMQAAFDMADFLDYPDINLFAGA